MLKILQMRRAAAANPHIKARGLQLIKARRTNLQTLVLELPPSWEVGLEEVADPHVAR
jgi:hypothetical protein